MNIVIFFQIKKMNIIIIHIQIMYILNTANNKSISVVADSSKVVLHSMIPIRMGVCS